MNLLSPGYLVAAGVVALGLVAMHFLSTDRPKSHVLPTVRFIPEGPVRATSRAFSISDLVLLALRVLAILLVGFGFAGVRLAPYGHGVARIVVIDVSRAVARPREVADSAARYIGGGATVILFDSTAREIGRGATDSLARLGERPTLAGAGRGVLSAALVTALRAASRLRESADSLQLTIISPFATEEHDAATDSIRALWPGRIDRVRVQAAPDTRTASSPPKLEWPDSGNSSGWKRRLHADTVGAVRVGETVVVFPFERRWQLDGSVATPVRVYARWADGEPAIVQRSVNADCIRSIALSLPNDGDAILRPEFERFIAALSAPCEEIPRIAPMSDGAQADLSGQGSLAPRAAVVARSHGQTPLTPWLFGAATLLLLLELLVRRTAAERSSSLERGETEGIPRKAA